MARLPRFVIPGQPQHIIQRGNDRQDIFCSEDHYLFDFQGVTHRYFKWADSLIWYFLRFNLVAHGYGK